MLLNLILMARCESVDFFVCIKKGRLVDGAVTATTPADLDSAVQLEPGKTCQDGSLVLEVGTYLNGKQLTKGGLCLSKATVVYGTVEVLEDDLVIPDPADTTKCSLTSNIVLLPTAVFKTLPKTESKSVLVIQEDRLDKLMEAEYSYSQVKLEKLDASVCLERGTIVDGVIDVKSNLEIPSGYRESCVAGSVLVQAGVGLKITNKVTVPLPTAFCMSKGQILSGRVITQSYVQVGKELSNKKTCSADGSNSVVANKDVILAIPVKKSPPSYDKPYEYHPGKPAYKDEYYQPSPYYKYNEYSFPRQEERRNYRDEPKRIDEYKRKGKSNFRKELGLISDLIDDRVISKLKQKERSMDY